MTLPAPLQEITWYDDMARWDVTTRRASYLECLYEIPQMPDFLPGVSQESRLQIDPFLFDERH